MIEDLHLKYYMDKGYTDLMTLEEEVLNGELSTE
jgi:hypothetical protein